MTTPFYYSTKYTLDKSHFSETFDESITVEHSLSLYFKSIGLILIGFVILYFADTASYAAWFIVVLGVVEGCSVFFKKPWWLARQMISEAANVELTLTINEDGVGSKSFSVDSTLLWEDISKIEQTKQGWLLYHANGRNYLSARCLSEATIAYIRTKAALKTDQSQTN